MLVTALRAFTGELPPIYANEREFFLTSLFNMEVYLAELQKETLEEVCDSFARKLDSGKATPGAIGELKAALDSLISEADFKIVCASMAGSPAFIKQKLSGVRPVSAAAAAKKGLGADPAVERRVNSVYSRLGFAALLRQVESFPNDHSVNSALRKARAAVAEYCCLYRVQLHAADTLTPFSMSCVDAALAASHTLFKNICRATGRAM